MGPELFSEFALPYLQEINEKVKSGIEERGLGKIPMVSIVQLTILLSIIVDIM